MTKSKAIIIKPVKVKPLPPNLRDERPAPPAQHRDIQDMIFSEDPREVIAQFMIRAYIAACRMHNWRENNFRENFFQYWSMWDRIYCEYMDRAEHLQPVDDVYELGYEHHGLNEVWDAEIELSGDVCDYRNMLWSKMWLAMLIHLAGMSKRHAR